MEMGENGSETWLRINNESAFAIWRGFAYDTSTSGVRRAFTRNKCAQLMIRNNNHKYRL